MNTVSYDLDTALDSFIRGINETDGQCFRTDPVTRKTTVKDVKRGIEYLFDKFQEAYVILRLLTGELNSLKQHKEKSMIHLLNNVIPTPKVRE